MKESSKSGLVILFGICMLPFACMINAWAICKLWGWYVIPFGAPQVTFAWAYGLLVLVKLVTHESDALLAKKEGLEWDDYLGVFIDHLIGPTLSVFAGWIALHWMLQ